MFAITSIAVLLLLSAMALIAIGIPYASSGGLILSKIHPATWIAVPAVLLTAFAHGGPTRFAARLMVASPGVVVFGIAVALLFLHVALVQRLPVSAIVDTLVLPMFLFAMVSVMAPEARRTIASGIDGFIVLNAVLGLVEYVTRWRLTPMFDIDGTIIVDWRSTALLGHPLNNAFVTGVWMVMLASGAAPERRPIVRIAAMALGAAALVAFGGRVAMVFAFLFLAVLGGLGGMKLLAGRRFDLGGAAAALAVATVLAVATILLVDGGAADRLIARFADDAGSAGTRIAMFNIFGDLGWAEFLIAPPPDLMQQAQREYGIRIGIESTEVAFVAFYGVIMATLVLAGLAAFLRELVRATSIRSLWAIAFFVVVMSASTGLASKSTNLAVFTTMVLTMMPRRDDGPFPSVTLR